MELTNENVAKGLEKFADHLVESCQKQGIAPQSLIFDMSGCSECLAGTLGEGRFFDGERVIRSFFDNIGELEDIEDYLLHEGLITQMQRDQGMIGESAHFYLKPGFSRTEISAHTVIYQLRRYAKKLLDKKG